jgi:coenzyme F420-reducing hydrogenase alpha subunit
LALELVLQDIQALDDDLIALTDKYNLHKLKEAHEANITALIEEDKVKGGRDLEEALALAGGGSTSSKGSKGGSSKKSAGFDVFGTGYKKVHDSLEVDVYNQFIEREVRKAREEKQRQLANLDKIKKAWGGVSLGECFFAWRKYARLNINTKVRDAARAKRAKFEVKKKKKKKKSVYIHYVCTLYMENNTLLNIQNNAQ